MAKVFIAYSQEDEDWLSILSLMLMPLREKHPVSAWSDQPAQAGTEWKNEIAQELSEADLFIALVSQSLLDSRFIMEKLVPAALEREKRGLCRVFWISARLSKYPETVFSEREALNDPGKPLSALQRNEIENEVLGISVQIRNHIFQLADADPGAQLPDSASDVIRIQGMVATIHRLQRDQKQAAEIAIHQTLRVINSNTPMELTMLTVLTQNASKVQEQIRYDMKIVACLESLAAAGVNLGDYGLPTAAKLREKIAQDEAAYAVIMKDLAKSKSFVYALSVLRKPLPA